MFDNLGPGFYEQRILPSSIVELRRPDMELDGCVDTGAICVW